jgi:hypothetical protein
MQDAFVGDVGDYGKYALLNALAGSDLRLGVMWVNNPDVVRSGEGNLVNYQRLEHCDPGLYSKLQKVLNGDRRISEIEGGEILPPDTRFYRDFVPTPRYPCSSPALAAQQRTARERWFGRGLAALADASLVFFDPDNGLPPSGMGKHLKDSGKYTFLDEVAACVASGKSAVLYQHLRRSSVESHLEEQMPMLRTCAPGCWAVSFHRWSVRIFYVLPASEAHNKLLRERTCQFVGGLWGGRGGFEQEHFQVHGMMSAKAVADAASL